MTWTLANGYTVRPVQESELDAILEVYRQCEDFLALTPVPTATMEMVRGDLAISAQNGGLFCGIYAPDGLMVGVLDLIPKGFERNPHHAFIELMMISRPHRNGGLGAMVTAAAEQYVMQDTQVSAMFTAVMVNNIGGQRFWERQGYDYISEPQLQDDGTTSRYLRKNLVR